MSTIDIIFDVIVDYCRKLCYRRFSTFSWTIITIVDDHVDVRRHSSTFVEYRRTSSKFFEVFRDFDLKCFSQKNSTIFDDFCKFSTITKKNRRPSTLSTIVDRSSRKRKTLSTGVDYFRRRKKIVDVLSTIVA